MYCNSYLLHKQRRKQGYSNNAPRYYHHFKNAYTLLTLDSITVANFIATEQIVNEDAINIINFYNHRNYQYAWFDEEGLIEQGEAF